MNASGHTRFGHRYIESDEDVLRSPSENEYPDPESLSTYPWWRDTIAAGDVAINSEPEQPHTLHRSSSEQGQCGLMCASVRNSGIITKRFPYSLVDQTNNYDAKTTSDVSDKGFR